MLYLVLDRVSEGDILDWLHACADTDANQQRQIMAEATAAAAAVAAAAAAGEGAGEGAGAGAGAGSGETNMGGGSSSRHAVVRVNKDEEYTERIAAGILWQLLEAVEALHAIGIVHRDIRPENIRVQVRELHEYYYIIICSGMQCSGESCTILPLYYTTLHYTKPPVPTGI